MVGTLCAAVGTGEANLYALVTDHHGTPMAEIRLTTGNQTRFSRLDPYGNERVENATWQSHTGYVGGTDDNTTGLTHLGAREYDPATGRFLSADPVLDLTDPLQANGYTYSNNNPVTHADPTGLTSTASDYDAAEASLDAQIAAQEKILAGSVTDIVRTYGWALFKEFIGWNDVVSCFTQGDLWACGSLLLDAIPWAKVFKLAYKVAKVVDRIISGIKALNKAKDVARKTIASLKAAKAAVQRAKAIAKQKAAEALKKAKEKALAAKAAAKRKTNTGSKGTAGKAEQTKASAGAKSNDAKKAKDNHADGGDSTDADDSGSGGSCEDPHSFLPGTQVLLADGTTKAIEDVENGDKLAANDPETSTTSATETATATITTYDDKDFTVLTVKTTDGTTAKLTTTDTHPFWVTDPAADPTDGTWVEGGALKSGQWLQTSAGTHVQITAITRYTKTQVTHDLTVSRVHTYYVLAGQTPVLVHNCGSGGDDDLVTVYRGTDMGLENMVAEESGHLMSDAARSTYAGTGSMDDAMKASQQAHADALGAWGSLDNYVQAHGSFGTEMSEIGPRSMMSFTTDVNVARSFGGTVYAARIPRSQMIMQTLPGAGEAEVLIPHMIAVTRL